MHLNWFGRSMFGGVASAAAVLGLFHFRSLLQLGGAAGQDTTIVFISAAALVIAVFCTGFFLATRLALGSDGRPQAPAQRKRGFPAVMDVPFVGLIHLDHHGVILDANTFAARLLGFFQGELIGQNISNFIPELDTGRADTFLRRLLEGSAPALFEAREIQGRTRDGVRKPLLVHLSLLGNLRHKGKGDGVLVAFLDESVKENFQSFRSALINSLAGELRSPLATLSGALEMLGAQKDGSTATRDPAGAYLQAAMSSTSKLMDFVNDLSDLELGAEGRIQMKFQPIDAGPFLEKALSQLHREAAAHQVGLSAFVPSGRRVFVLVDDGRFSHMLRLLVRFLLRFAVPGAHVDVSLRPNENMVRFEVLLDKGRVPEMYFKLFQMDATRDDDPFELASEPSLFLARAIVKKHGSILSLQTGDEAGTFFQFEMPTYTEPGMPTSFKPQRLRASDQKPVILCLEDDPDLVRLLKSSLSEFSEVLSATTVEEARRMVASNPPDLVVLDMSLPDGPGFSLVPLVRQLQPPPVVIVYSAFDPQEHVRKRVDAYFVKSRESLEDLQLEIRKRLGINR